MTETYCYSRDEEMYRGEFETREAALLEAVDGQTGVTVWTGKQTAVDVLRYLPDADDLIERMMETAYDEVGECSESWLDTVSKEQRADLTDTIRSAVMAWLDKNNLHPNFWSVDDVEQHDIPAAPEPPPTEQKE